MLRRANRFHGYNSLRYVYQHGATVRATDVALKYSLNNKRSSYRAAVVVGKKVHKSAVVRNRIRRRIFEQLRLHSGDITQAYDLVITVHSDRLATMPADELATIISSLLTQAKILQPSRTDT